MLSKLKDDTFTIVAAFVVGFLQLSIFFGYNVMGFTVESVMHSVKTRCPDCIPDFAGYYGQCLVYAVYTFSNFFAPGILHSIGIRKTLIIATVCFLIYTASFLYIHKFLYFPASALGGFGLSLYYLGAGTYSAKHSTNSTFSRNQAIYWTVAQFCWFPVGMLMIVTNKFNEEIGVDGILIQIIIFSTNDTSRSYRHYTESEINLMTYGSLTVQFLGLLTAIFMPSREIPNSIFCKIPRTSQSQQIKNMFSSITKSSLLLLAPLHLFRGMYIAFWLTIYPTTIAFTGQFAKNHNLIGYICIAFTIGEIALGFFISHFSKKVKDFGLWPVFSMVIGSFSLNVLVWVLFTPKLSSIQPTNDPAIFENCIPIVIAMGALNGIVDGCLNNVIMVILPKVLPSNPAVSFSISKFYQSIASATFYFVSSLLTVHQLGALLTFTLATAAVGFSIVVKRVKAAHQIAPEGKK